MIKYNGTKSKFFFKKEDVDLILKVIDDTLLYNQERCTKENITLFTRAIDTFLSNIKEVKENVVLERHETEEEAREYFGSDFIEKFDNLLMKLDKEETIVALHGTDVPTCEIICKEGLKCRENDLCHTTLLQSMAYGRNDVHYNKYETLLNWPHRCYKGLAIVAVPYECFYKEGLWDKTDEETLSPFGDLRYRINPDFIVGYIDVTNKDIILNPKYNKDHNYEGYELDDRAHINPEMTNDKYKKFAIESSNKSKLDNTDYVSKFDIETIHSYVENLYGIFNSFTRFYTNGIDEDVFLGFKKELYDGYDDIKASIPLLKTNKQVEDEALAKQKAWEEEMKKIWEANKDKADDDWGIDVNDNWEFDELEDDVKIK